MNKILWNPDSLDLKESKMALFMSYINQTYNTSIKDYSILHEWSINHIDEFWKTVSDFFKIKYSNKAKKIMDNNGKMFDTKWFWGAKLNYAENISGLDLVEEKGVKVFIEPDAVMFLIGSKMDYLNDKLTSRFTFINPNEKSTCGCGESFNI